MSLMVLSCLEGLLCLGPQDLWLFFELWRPYVLRRLNYLRVANTLRQTWGIEGYGLILAPIGAEVLGVGVPRFLYYSPK